MNLIQRTRTYVICPACGADAGCVDHLLRTDTHTAWYCDACGQRFRLDCHKDGVVDVAVMPGERKIETADVLKLPPQEVAVYFVVSGMRFEGTRWSVEKEDEQKRFFYEEHSCPTNWLKPLMVYYAGDADPHGLIEFVRSVDAASLPPNEPYGPNDHDRALVDIIEEAADGR